MAGSKPAALPLGDTPAETLYLRRGQALAATSGSRERTLRLAAVPTPRLQKGAYCDGGGISCQFRGMNHPPGLATACYGRIAKARAGKPRPFSTFGQVTTITAPVAGTWSRFASTSIWKWFCFKSQVSDSMVSVVSVSSDS